MGCAGRIIGGSSRDIGAGPTGAAMGSSGIVGSTHVYCSSGSEPYSRSGTTLSLSGRCLPLRFELS
jgi:hypothetical protein